MRYKYQLNMQYVIYNLFIYLFFLLNSVDLSNALSYVSRVERHCLVKPCEEGQSGQSGQVKQRDTRQTHYVRVCAIV